MRAFGAETLCTPIVIVMTAPAEPVSGNLNANRSYQFHQNCSRVAGCTRRLPSIARLGGTCVEHHKLRETPREGELGMNVDGRSHDPGS